MKISSLSDLEILESQIEKKLSKYKLGDVFHSLYSLKEDNTIQPFMIAGLSLLAARFCLPSKSSQLIRRFDIRPLVDLSNNYYLSDPTIFDKDLHDESIDSNPIFMMLRIVSNQFPFKPGLFSQFSRPVLLFHEIPNQLRSSSGIPQFNFEDKFYSLTGVSVIDFVTTGFVLSAFARNNFTFSQSYLTKSRQQGINIPDKFDIKKILNHLVADKSKLVDLYERQKNIENKDNRFRMYDFNPLLSYPLIKPCDDKGFARTNKDFMHAPVPELIGSRISTGIFYQMYNEWKTEFSGYFGHVFERYVGLVLNNCTTSETLISDADIREFYPEKKGKAPDWILIDGKSLVLFECKATRFSRAAQAIASEKDINSSLLQVKKGLIQLHSFITACRNNIPELQRFYDCTTFKPIFVSLEPLYLINSFFFRDHINTLLADEGITGFDWQILSIDDLERLQPHLKSGFRFSQVLDDLKQKTFNSVLQDLSSQTNQTFADSFLYQKQHELYQRLGVSDRIS
ncbi:hypothetical protein HCU40_22715 (plasmid) [Pseudanabaena biceps]|nr:hypothetical protein [Pseudanabaena biceps]